MRIGCSGWAYKHWRGIFYPVELPQSRWFSRYAEEFDTVEINNSFYRLPSLETFETWRCQAPPDFCYSVKANRYLTQAKKLKECDDPLQRMMTAVRELEPKLGPLLYQLPPNMKVDLNRLESFLKILPEGFTSVFEFRHLSWFSAPVYELLENYGASFCVHDMPGSVTPRVAVGPAAYLRLHGTRGKYWGRYLDQQLIEWADWLLDQLRLGRTAWCYFNNDIEGHAIEDARALKSIVHQSIERPIGSTQWHDL